ncbi:hypothetical protein BD309DRAFT_927106 [Dichomitus squalens]|uniref:Uncharacterized protein n=1 Tax=Dichomitus squalens TaxID=114155 RepID=A0A4Q9PVQ1_9APHY|nr:hypothetical protein BD309DRAFT_927106 [Dichomitus squalens]TBU58707.1 hypothetical protein BD310DRAFT_850525 [Dichomitus squalens]
MANKDLLKILEAHGQQFLQSFDTPVTIGKRKDGPTTTEDRSTRKKNRQEDESEEEWAGIGQGSSSGEEEDSDDEGFDEDDPSGGEGESDDGDDEFTYESGSRQPDIVVFSEASTSSMIPKKSKSGFMSSKVTKLTEEARRPANKKSSEDDEDDDLSNAQNDALLHRLVHTQLLSGSLNPDLNLTPAQRKKALAGRVMEAAGKAKLGKGEAAVRQKEHNRAAKHVRDGLTEKKKERQQKELEEAKQLGNYHPALKALYDASSTSHLRKKKRDRGMKMGVGSFKGGILKLSKSEISAVEGRSRGESRGTGSRRRGGKR